MANQDFEIVYRGNPIRTIGVFQTNFNNEVPFTGTLTAVTVTFGGFSSFSGPWNLDFKLNGTLMGIDISIDGSDTTLQATGLSEAVTERDIIEPFITTLGGGSGSITVPIYITYTFRPTTTAVLADTDEIGVTKGATGAPASISGANLRSSIGSAGGGGVGGMGEEGPPGETFMIPGPRGADGAAGATGPAGPIGFPGMDGSEGESILIPGPVGPQGNPGATGATLPGQPGPQGDDGEPGEAWMIPGPPGPAGAGGGGSDPWENIFKTTTQARDLTTTLTDDSTLLTASLTANTFYWIELKIMFSVDSGTPGFKFRHNLSQTPQNSLIKTRYPGTMIGLPNNTTPTEHLGGGANAAGTTFTSTGSFFGWAEMSGWIQTHATLGSVFALQWAQSTSSADDIRIYAGSYLRYAEAV